MDIIYIIILVIAALLCYLYKKEKFTVNQKENIKATLKTTWDDILDISEPKYKSFDNSNKISVSNIIRVLKITSFLFNYKLNLNLTFYRNIIIDS